MDATLLIALLGGASTLVGVLAAWFTASKTATAKARNDHFVNMGSEISRLRDDLAGRDSAYNENHERIKTLSKSHLSLLQQLVDEQERVAVLEGMVAVLRDEVVELQHALSKARG